MFYAERTNAHDKESLGQPSVVTYKVKTMFEANMINTYRHFTN